MRYFEDIAVGQKASFGNYAVTREEVLEFAGKYDPQPFHLSDEAAAQTHFGRLAASGWHSCAMAMSMLVEHFKSVEHAGLGSPGIDELRFLKPVYPGDVLHVESEVLEKTRSRSKPEMGSYRSRIELLNQDGVAVVRFTAIDLIRVREAP
jgi:acyl dehydratase